MALATGQTVTIKNKALISCFIAALLILNWLPFSDVMAQAYLSDTIASNAIVFGVVRSLNAVISVIQSAEVGVGVAGITLGEIFDPVNDLIERFSSLLLVTLTALGIQQVLLLITTSLTVKIIFSLFSMLSLIVIWHPSWGKSSWIRWMVLIIFLRYLLTLEVSLVWLFDWLYFDATGQQALSVLEAATHVVDSIKERITEIDLSKLIFGSDKVLLSSDDIGTEIATSVVTLIVGMLFKSIFIPIGSLWIGYKTTKNIVINRS